MSWLVILALFEIYYAYVGYPILLAILLACGFRRVAGAPQETFPRVSVIVTVRNEATVLREKIENTLYLRAPRANNPLGNFQLIIASDASDDGTDEIVREFSSRGVQLVRLETRGGKEQAQKKAIEKATGDIIVFTDAKIRLQEDALECFIERFRDPRVGAVSSVDVIVGEEGGEGAYVRYEMWLRSMESDFSTLVGLSGSCFAVRKDVALDIPSDIPSDFALLLAAKKRGYAGVHAPEIIGTYEAVATHEAEFRRKVRTVLRGMSALFARKEVMGPSEYGSFAWQVISHKLCRWLVPWAFLIAFFGSFFGSGTLLIIFQLLFAVFFILAGLGAFHPDLRDKWFCKLPLFFLVVNAGIAVAWFYFLTGRRFVSWSPSEKGKANA